MNNIKRPERDCDPAHPSPSNAAEFITDDGRRFVWSESNSWYEEVEKDDGNFTVLRNRLRIAEERLQEVEPDRKSLRRELATIFGPSPIHHGMSWNACMLLKIGKKLGELEDKIEYAKKFGLDIGIAKSSDCPEGKLAHDTVEGSTLHRLEKGIGDLIDAELEIERLKQALAFTDIEVERLRKIIEPKEE